jgi:hypothetical protein
MTDNRLSEAFKRHPRPQALNFPETTISPQHVQLVVPTKAALARRSTEAQQSTSPSCISRKRSRAALEPAVLRDTDSSLSMTNERRRLSVKTSSPWREHIRLGVLVQGVQQLIICASSPDRESLCMFKSMKARESNLVFECFPATKHPNLVTVLEASRIHDLVYLKMEYSRHTLEEVLRVSLTMTESHIRVLARSVCVLCDLGEWR